MKHHPSKQSANCRLGIWICGILGLLCVAADAQPGTKFTHGPQSGDVFKEYLFKCPAWKALDDSMTIDDLQDALKAELSVEYWGGHFGTIEQRLILNGRDDKPIYYPLPANTPERPDCLLRQMYGNSGMEFPLEILKEGMNTFKFAQAPERICDDKTYFPNTITYSLIFRIYYKSTKAHPTGTITSPASGTTIGYRPKFTIDVKENGNPVKRVDYIAHYEDFDWEGNGIFEQWHYRVLNGELVRQAARSDRAPFSATWANYDVPDQTKPIKIMARIRDKSGMCFMTPAVENVTLERSYSVKLCRSSNFSQRFASMTGSIAGCNIDLPKDISKASMVKLVVSSWSAGSPPGTNLFLNHVWYKNGGWGQYNAPSLDIFTIHDSIYTTWQDTVLFRIMSQTKHHPCEINWPGPVVLARYGKLPGGRIVTPWKEQARSGNPATIKIVPGGVHYSIPNVGPFSLTMTDPLGRTRAQTLGKGPQSGILRPASTAGIYFLLFRAGDREFGKKVLLINSR